MSRTAVFGIQIVGPFEIHNNITDLNVSRPQTSGILIHTVNKHKGLVFKCHLNTVQPNYLNTRQMDAILFIYVLVEYSNGGLVHRI